MTPTLAPDFWKDRRVGSEFLPPDQFLAHPDNARIHTWQQEQAVEALLDEVGWIDAIKVNVETGYVVDGHLRVNIALRKNLPAIPVDYVRLTADEEALVLAYYDYTGAIAGFDPEKLQVLDKQLGTIDKRLEPLRKELWAAYGVDNGEGVTEDDPPDMSRADELQQKWQVQTGDLWQIGVHRLLCGDSTKADDVARVMGGEKADAVVTDPPYGVGIEYGGFDDRPDNTKIIVKKVMDYVLGFDCPAAITSGHRLLLEYPPFDWMMAWIHPAGTGLGPWGFTTFNPILVYGKDPYLANGLGSRSDSVVMSADRQGMKDHPVAKPLEVWGWLVERMSVKSRDVIFDPFGGSGTTMVACEQLKRRCRMIEIHPPYCAVILERMEALGVVGELVESQKV